jgi:hypothetical protein
MDYDKLFWSGVIIYILTTALYIVGRAGDVGLLYILSVFAAVAMFVGSKIGRSFLGLA